MLGFHEIQGFSWANTQLSPLPERYRSISSYWENRLPNVTFLTSSIKLILPHPREALNKSLSSYHCRRSLFFSKIATWHSRINGIFNRFPLREALRKNRKDMLYFPKKLGQIPIFTSSSPGTNPNVNSARPSLF